jgi:SAM-dependent methyltransferase
MPKYSAVRFDGQAETHEQRTGIPEEKCLEVARAIESLAAAAKNRLLLDLGAGTGLPGAWFPEVGFRYVGLDASEPMLKLFAERRQPSPGAVDLVLADVDGRWPVEDGTVDVVFSSRAAHLFDREHLVAEAERVAKPGAAFVLGRVQREKRGMRRRLRDEMRARLRERGFEPTDAGKAHERIVRALRERGAKPLPSTVAAAWQARHSAADVLNAWKTTSGLGGCELAPGSKEEILAELWIWAEKNLDSVDAPLSSEERFTLEAVRMGPA